MGRVPLSVWQLHLPPRFCKSIFLRSYEEKWSSKQIEQLTLCEFLPRFHKYTYELKWNKKKKTLQYLISPSKLFIWLKSEGGGNSSLPSKYWHCRFSTSSKEVAFPCWKRCRVTTHWGALISNQPCTAAAQHGVSFWLTSTSFSASVAQKS